MRRSWRLLGRLAKSCARARAQRGQTLVEFAIVVPLFMLMVFGIVQAVLLLRANSALGQAATDGAHVVAAQSSSGPLNANGDPDPTYPTSWQADGDALAYIQAALTSQGMTNIQEIDIYPAAPSAGTPDQPTNLVQTRAIAASVDLPSTAITQTIQLVNEYRPQPPSGGPTCPVGQFYLYNPLPSPFATSSSPSNCVLPWNGEQYSYSSNQNGRSDQRCAESLVYVKITYSYQPIGYPLIPAVTLVAHAVAPMEPRQYIVDANTQQSIACSQFPAFNNGGTTP